MLLLQEEKTAKPKKDDRYNDVLYHPGRGNTSPYVRLASVQSTSHCPMKFSFRLPPLIFCFNESRDSRRSENLRSAGIGAFFTELAAGRRDLNALRHAIFFSNPVSYALLFLIPCAGRLGISRDGHAKTKAICKQLETDRPNSRWRAGAPCA